ncbi:MAG: FadR/GntR family transcriptional regulator [Anaerolineaceae bacterium]|nr:FadR/GntR family transcriptional regulator [Anaerolineaceae bacterium]
MNLPLKPLQVESLKDACITRMEELILSGELKAGERLPAERDLANRLGVSRPVLHEALVDLAVKGLVSILPRRGVVVNDYRQSGSMAILSSLLNYQNGQFDPQFTDSLFAMRLLIEKETARLAATNTDPEQLGKLHELLSKESSLNRSDLAALVKLDFDFHIQVALASKNHIYPLILNSFVSVYTHFTTDFFERCRFTPTLDEVFAFHRELVNTLEQHQPQKAMEVMTALLEHGKAHLLDFVDQTAHKE